MNKRLIEISRRASLAAVAFILIVAGWARAQTTVSPLRVATIPSDFAAEVYYAKDLGYFEKAGLDVTITPVHTGAAIVSAVLGGSIDVGYSNMLSILIAHDKSFPVTIVMPANLYESKAGTIGLLSVAKTSPIHTAADLNGKTVAVPGLNTTAELTARNWIDKNGGDSKTVHFVEVPLSSMAPALLGGRIDCAAFDSTAAPDLRKPTSEFRLLGQSYDSVGPSFASGAWFSSDDFVTKHPEATKKFIAVMKQTAAWANTHHRESAIILAKYLNVPAESYDTTPRVAYETKFSPDGIKAMIDLAARYGAIKTAVEPRALINPIALQ